MDVRSITLAALTATCLAAVGCSSAPTANTAPALTSAERPTRASMVANDDIGAAIFADDTALAGDFRPYAGRLDGASRAAFMTQAGETAVAGVRTD